MKIAQTIITGVTVIHSDPFQDERGFFNRIFCRKELEVIRSGIVIAQINHSMTKQKGTIRGMHFQNPPHAEMKIVRCIKGSIFEGTAYKILEDFGERIKDINAMHIEAEHGQGKCGVRFKVVKYYDDINELLKINGFEMVFFQRMDIQYDSFWVRHEMLKYK